METTAFAEISCTRLVPREPYLPGKAAKPTATVVPGWRYPLRAGINCMKLLLELTRLESVC